jgi:hypothetical protein
MGQSPFGDSPCLVRRDCPARDCPDKRQCPGPPCKWKTKSNSVPLRVVVIRPGDRVFFEAGEDHWHGAPRDRFMTHVAMLEVDDHGNPATWGDHVTDDEYAAVPAIDD